MKKIILMTLLCSIAASSLQSHEQEHKDDAEHHNKKADDHHEDHENHDDDHHQEISNAGPGYAVIEADVNKGFKLSDLAMKRIGVQWIKLDGVSIPSSATVHELTFTGIYRRRDGWIKFVSVEDLNVGDQIAVSAVGLLRITELDLFTEDVEGHAH